MCGCGHAHRLFHTAREIPVGCSKKLLLTCRVATQHRTRARHTKSTAGQPLPAFDQLSTLDAFNVRCSRVSLPSMSGNPLYSLLCEGWEDRWLACIDVRQQSCSFCTWRHWLNQSPTRTPHTHKGGRESLEMTRTGISSGVLWEPPIGYSPLTAGEWCMSPFR
jgi:hypothetical protein